MSLRDGLPSPGRLPALRRRIRFTALDATPLRESHDFRFLFLSQAFSILGVQTRAVGIPYMVFEATHSSLWVGLVGLAQLIPSLLIALFAGELVDNLDRRNLLIVAETLLTVVALLLALTGAASRSSLEALFVLVMLAAALDVLDQPTRTAVIPRLVEREQVAAALDLMQASQQVGTIVGPLIVGLLLTEIGPAHAFIFGAVASAVTVVCLLPLDALPPLPFAGERKSGLAAAREALAYVKGRPLLAALFLIALNGTFVGGPYVLFPVLALQIFNDGGFGLGLMYAATGTGALVASLVSSAILELRHQGRALVVASAVSGAAIACFGLVTHAFWLALLLLCVVGAADMFNSVFRAAILELSVPDYLRGRLSVDDFILFNAGERLGDLKTSAIARWAGNNVTVVGGGLAQLLIALAIGAATPALLRYQGAVADHGTRDGSPSS